MQPFDVQQQIDQILDKHVQGKRRADQTLDNLKNLFRSLRFMNDQQLFENHLISRFILELGSGKRPPTNGVSPRPEPAAIIMSVLLELSLEQERMLAVLLSNLSPRNDKALEVWTNEALPEIAMAVHLKRVKGPSINLLKNILWLHSTKRNTNLLPGEIPPSLSLAVDQVLDAVEDAEFSDFEEQLRSKAGRPSAEELSAPEQDQVPERLRKALSEAEAHLKGTQILDPKKAADLIRTCMDEAHSDLVSKTALISAKPYTGAHKDGERRVFLRDIGLFTLPEETFFSSLYKLLSEEASHKLIAPRETVLIMNYTISSYIELLYRRFEDWKTKRPGAKP